MGSDQNLDFEDPALKEFLNSYQMDQPEEKKPKKKKAKKAKRVDD